MGLSPGHYSLTFGDCSLAVGAGTAVAARLVKSHTPRRVLTAGVAAVVVVSALLLVTTGTGSAVLGFQQYGTGALAGSIAAE